MSVKWNLTEVKKFLKQLDFSKANGLVVILIQDWQTNEVLMCGFANEAAVIESLITGYAHFYSRSRKALWKKGEISGHTQEIKEVLIDCDADTILYKVEQKVAACHKGFKSCFYRKLELDGNLSIVTERIFNPSDVY